MTLLACIPVTGCLTLAEVAACSLSAADNTYPLDTAVNVVFEDDGGVDILTIYEANRGVQAHAHAAMGAQAAIDGGSLSPGIEVAVLDIEETFTGPVVSNAGELIYLRVNSDTDNAFVVGLDVFVSDEGSTAESFSPYGLQFTVFSYNDDAYGYGFIGTFQTQAGAADTAYGGYISFYSNDGSTNYAAAIALETAIFGGTVNEMFGLVIYDVSGATTNKAIETNAGHIVFNEGSHDDTDFRVEGATDTHLLFTDGSADRVGINDSTPDGKLDIVQSSTTGAIPVIELEQLDLSEEFFNFVGTVATGNPIEAIGSKTLTTTHFIRVAVNGSFLYFPVGTIA